MLSFSHFIGPGSAAAAGSKAFFLHRTIFPTLSDHFDGEPQGVNSKRRHDATNDLHYILALLCLTIQTFPVNVRDCDGLVQA